MATPFSAASLTLNFDDAARARATARSSTGSPNLADMSQEVGRSGGSAVSWSAIFAGAVAAAALSLILLILGTGLGLSSVSPWASAGIGATAFGVSTILWLSVTQFIASGMGGYLAGHLRTKHVSVHTDEVYFRDTAHGFLAWAVASLLTASVLASAVGGIVGAGAALAGGAASGVASTAASTAATASATASAMAATGAAAASSSGGSNNPSAADPVGYLMDSMLRRVGTTTPLANGANTDASSSVSAAEIGRVFMNSIKQGALPAEDLKYVAGAVAARSGLTPDEAEARVKATFESVQVKLREAEASAKQAADTTRKATAYGALWLFISLLIGAFFASWGATFGGRSRDF